MCLNVRSNFCFRNEDWHRVTDFQSHCSCFELTMFTETTISVPDPVLSLGAIPGRIPPLGPFAPRLRSIESSPLRMSAPAELHFGTARSLRPDHPHLASAFRNWSQTWQPVVPFSLC